MRLLRNSVLGVLGLAAIAVGLAPNVVLADDDGAPLGAAQELKRAASCTVDSIEMSTR